MPPHALPQIFHQARTALAGTFNLKVLLRFSVVYRSAISSWPAAALLAFALAVTLPAAEAGKKLFDLPVGAAEQSLKAFAAQSGLEVLFVTDVTQGVRTNEVKGEFTPRQALDRLLAGTNLVVSENKATGALKIRQPEPGPNGGGAASSSAPSVADEIRSSATSPRQSEDGQRGVVNMSPFVISSEGDDGYRAANTLAGSRMNTSLLVTPAAISVLTKELLDDIGAKKTEDFLRYAMSSDHDGSTEALGSASQNFDVRVKIRGFSDNTITRDYFPFARLSSDRFNIERVDLNRGPNSILYGIGSPGGVINSSSKQASIGGSQKSLSLSFGSFSKKRAEMDLAFPMAGKKLALRVNTLVEDRLGWADFEFLKQKGLALASTFRPFKGTNLRAGYETVDRRQLIPRIFPSWDLGGTRWIAAGAPLAGNPLLPGTNPDPTLLRTRTTPNVIFAPQLRAQPFRISTGGADMRPDLPGTQTTGFWETVPGAASPVAGTVDDPFIRSMVPERANLTGPGATSNNDYQVGSVFLEQRLGPVSLEVAGASLLWRRHVKFTQATGLIGDPNPVLPGAYYANGDSTVTGGANPGTLLPDIGALNPQAGGLYVEGNAQQTRLRGQERHARVTLGYEADFTRRSPWFGRHQLAALWQKSKSLSGNEHSREYNSTPGNSQLIESGTNVIIRRTYVDFRSASGTRGALDPWAHPIPTSTGVTGQLINFNRNPDSTTDLDTRILAGQSSFFGQRLVLTGGYREDVQKTNTAVSGAQRWPQSVQLYQGHDDVFDPARRLVFSGHTTTSGFVLLPWPWLGLVYNQANSILPQANLDIFMRPVGKRVGEGRDYGIRLSPLGGRLSVNANVYQTDDTNRAFDGLTNRTLAVPALNAILSTMAMLGQRLPPQLIDARLTQLHQQFNDRATYSGDGVEVEAVGRITKGWSLSANYSRNNVKLDNPGSILNGFHGEMKGTWDGNMTPFHETPSNVAEFVRQRDNTPGRDFNLNPATFNDAYDYVGEVLQLVNRQQGQNPLQHVTDSFNMFSSYRFGDGHSRWWRKLRVGVGGNYRSAPVIGYDASRENSPIFGKSTILVNAMLGRKFPLGSRRSLDVQLNVDNILGEDELLPYSATAPGRIVRYILPRVRRTWELRMSVDL
jgi:outer membrane receptor protein involved in Fe transport